MNPFVNINGILININAITSAKVVMGRVELQLSCGTTVKTVFSSFDEFHFWYNDALMKLARAAGAIGAEIGMETFEKLQGEGL